jgi:hypothetical protein
LFLDPTISCVLVRIGFSNRQLEENSKRELLLSECVKEMASKDEAKKERKLKSKEEEEEDDDDDEEDEDFVPGEASEDEEEEDVVDEDDELELKHKKRKLDKDESEVELSEEQLKAKEEQEKKKAEDIWSSFLKDVNQIAKKPSASSLSSTSNAQKSPLGHNFNTQTDKVKSR